MDIKKIDEILKNHEERISILENTSSYSKETKKGAFYKSGTTIELIVKLIESDFFNEPKSLKDIISKLKDLDIHLKSPDLTLPLRKIVRRGLLKKTKEISRGQISKYWLYKA